MNDVYDYTKPPLKNKFNAWAFLTGRKNCKIIVNYQQYKLLKITFDELDRRNIKLEVKENES